MLDIIDQICGSRWNPYATITYHCCCEAGVKVSTNNATTATTANGIEVEQILSTMNKYGEIEEH